MRFKVIGLENLYGSYKKAIDIIDAEMYDSLFISLPTPAEPRLLSITKGEPWRKNILAVTIDRQIKPLDRLKRAVDEAISQGSSLPPEVVEDLVRSHLDFVELILQSRSYEEAYMLWKRKVPPAATAEERNCTGISSMAGFQYVWIPGGRITIKGDDYND